MLMVIGLVYHMIIIFNPCTDIIFNMIDIVGSTALIGHQDKIWFLTQILHIVLVCLCAKINVNMIYKKKRIERF